MWSSLSAPFSALRSQTFSDFEIILINSSPEEETERLVRSEFPEVVFEQSLVHLYPHAARNRGVQLACGSVFVFTDPDCRARPDWLERTFSDWPSRLLAKTHAEIATATHRLVIQRTITGAIIPFHGLLSVTSLVTT